MSDVLNWGHVLNWEQFSILCTFWYYYTHRITTSTGMFPIPWNVSVIKGVGRFWLGVEQMGIEKQTAGFFSNFWVLKKGICDAFWNAFATRPPFTCEPRPTHPTLPELMNLKLTPHSRQMHLYHHLVIVGSVDFTMEKFQPKWRSVDLLIYIWM